jgi:hypothetical protein
MWKSWKQWSSVPRKQSIMLIPLEREVVPRVVLLDRATSLYTYRQGAAVPVRQELAGYGSSSSSGQELAFADTEWDLKPHVLVYIPRVHYMRAMEAMVKCGSPNLSYMIYFICICMCVDNCSPFCRLHYRTFFACIRNDSLRSMK